MVKKKVSRFKVLTSCSLLRLFEQLKYPGVTVGLLGIIIVLIKIIGDKLKW